MFALLRCLCVSSAAIQQKETRLPDFTSTIKLLFFSGLPTEQIILSWELAMYILRFIYRLLIYLDVFGDKKG
jgi:hypothetical protein